MHKSAYFCEFLHPHVRKFEYWNPHSNRICKCKCPHYQSSCILKLTSHILALKSQNLTFFLSENRRNQTCIDFRIWLEHELNHCRSSGDVAGDDNGFDVWGDIAGRFQVSTLPKQFASHFTSRGRGYRWLQVQGNKYWRVSRVLIAIRKLLVTLTWAQEIPFEFRLVLASGYKLLELASRLKLETGPRLADPCKIINKPEWLRPVLAERLNKKLPNCRKIQNTYSKPILKCQKPNIRPSNLPTSNHQRICSEMVLNGFFKLFLKRSQKVTQTASTQAKTQSPKALKSSTICDSCPYPVTLVETSISRLL